MTSALGKFVLLGKTGIHGMLDWAIDQQPIGVLRTRIRELEEGIDGIRQGRATELGNVQTFKQEREELTRKAERTEARVKMLLGDAIPENDASAKELAKRVVLNRRRIEELQRKEAEAQGRADQLGEYLSQAETKHQEAMDKLHELESLVQQQRGQERVNKSLQNLRGALEGSADAGVDDVASELRAKANREAALFDELMDDVGDEAEEDALSVEADQYLAELKTSGSGSEGEDKEAVATAPAS